MAREFSDDTSESRSPERRAGIVVRSSRGRYFVPAAVARKVTARPTVTPVPGTEFGMALISGQVVSVIEIGSPSGSLLVCDAEGQVVAVSGIELQEAGFFETAPGGVRVQGELFVDLDVGAIARSVSRKLGGASGESGPAS